jgi:hypothetical protein
MVVGLGLVAQPALARQTAPACAPATLDNSALQGGSVTVSPLAGSRDASPQTQISFLGEPVRDLRAISVVGSKTGVHSGRLVPYSQGDGASFLPSRAFAEGERVSVRARLHAGHSAASLLDEFVIAHEDPITTTPKSTQAGTPSEIQGFHSRADLQPPVVTVTAQSPAVAPGDLFLAPYAGPGQAGPMILEPNGGLVWFKPLPPNTAATDLQVQQYDGKPVLTWWHRAGHGV